MMGSAINGILQSLDPYSAYMSPELFKEMQTDTSVEFGFVPKLDELSFGEFIDLDKYLQDWDSMHKAMAVLFRPVSMMIPDYALIA